ncbi:MAG: glycosyltransferase [Promethearchaeota archaeon]
MNILIVFPHRNAIYPIGGATTRSWSIIKALVKNNFNVSILHSDERKQFEDKELKKKCKIYYLKNVNIYGLKEKNFDDINPFFIYKFYKVLRKNNFDVIQLKYPFAFFLIKL